jgi:hypothetical protein
VVLHQRDVMRIAQVALVGAYDQYEYTDYSEKSGYVFVKLVIRIIMSETCQRRLR